MWLPAAESYHQQNWESFFSLFRGFQKGVFHLIRWYGPCALRHSSPFSWWTYYLWTRFSGLEIGMWNLSRTLSGCHESYYYYLAINQWRLLHVVVHVLPNAYSKCKMSFGIEPRASQNHCCFKRMYTEIYPARLHCSNGPFGLPFRLLRESLTGNLSRQPSIPLFSLLKRSCSSNREYDIWWWYIGVWLWCCWWRWECKRGWKRQ